MMPIAVPIIVRNKWSYFYINNYWCYLHKVKPRLFYCYGSSD